MKTLTYTLQGKSLLDLKADGMPFWSSWWDENPFAKKKGRKGRVTMSTEPIKESFSKTWYECKELVEKQKGEMATASEVLEFVWLHFQKTKEWLLQGNYTWTTSQDSDGELVDVGKADPEGAGVYGWGPDRPHDLLGVVLSRFKELVPLESKKLEKSSEVTKIQAEGKKIIIEITIE